MSFTRTGDAARRKTYGAIPALGGVTPIPASPMANRLGIYIFNNNASGGAVLYLGYDTNLNIANGIPVPPQTGWTEDVASLTAAAGGGAGVPLVVYGVTTGGSTVDVRYTESGTGP